MKRISQILFCFIVLILSCILMYKETYENEKNKHIHIVIARYAEPLDWLCDDQIFNKISSSKTKTTIYIYNKGKDDITLCNIPDHISIQIKKIPNVGRCDHTYLHHIIENYDNLADVTIFLPGSANLHNKFERAKYLINKCYSDIDSCFICYKYNHTVKDVMGSFQLDNWMSSSGYNSHENNDDKLFLCPERPFHTWYEKVFGDLDVYHITFYGLFAVSKKHIHNRHIDFYNNLIQYLNTHHNPEVGHYIERAWIAIFHPIDESRLFLDHGL